MRGHVKELQLRLGAWFVSRRQMVSRDDSGAISTEMAIITALVGVAAVALATFLATNIGNWQADIPTP